MLLFWAILAVALSVATSAAGQGNVAVTPPDDPYRWVRDWISAVGPALAFFSAIGVAAYNASLTRKRDDQIRRSEARSLAIALQAEVRSNLGRAKWIQEELTHLKDFYQDTQARRENELIEAADAVEYVLKYFMDIKLKSLLFREALSKLGLFNAETSEKIVTFYYTMEDIMEIAPRTASITSTQGTLSRDELLKEAERKKYVVIEALNMITTISDGAKAVIIKLAEAVAETPKAKKI
jgi:hypothetical protein